MRATAFLAALVLSIPVATQTVKPVPPVPKVPVAPTISDAQRAAYWKAQSEALQALRNVENTDAYQASQQKQKALNAAIRVIVEVCGTAYDIRIDSNGDPVCVLKPAEKK